MPAWSASIVQVPTPTSETIDPDTLHTPALLGGAEKVTARPELVVAEAAYVPPTLPGDGGVEPKPIACVASATVNDCCACGAAK